MKIGTEIPSIFDFPACFAVIALKILLCCFFISIVFADQDQIEIIESNLTKEKQKYERLDSREKDLLGQLSAYEQDVAESRRSIEKLRERIRADKLETARFEKKLIDLEGALGDAESKGSKRLVSLYKYARKGYVRALASVMDFGQFRQRVKYLRAISQEDHNELSRLVKEVSRYQVLILQLREKIAQKKYDENQEKARLLAMRKDLEEKVMHLMKIHKEKEFYETAVKELELAAQDLKQTFTKIENNKKYETTWSSGFEDAKGLLPFPLEGKVIRGDRLLGSSHRHFNKGVFIEGGDKEVKAVFPGRIEFSGQLKGYGEIVIINHGSRFFTISAQLSQRMKEEGDTVETGDVIAIAGQNGAVKKARIYFEMRKAGKNLNPLEWMKELEKH